MASTMVIKVKYGEVLRRFSVPVNETNQLVLDINGLRAKIFDLFNFAPDADVTLTYIDEDGDTVTLVNDDDLQDVTRQQLKYLMIDVHRRNVENDQSKVRSNGSTTPLRLPRGQYSFQNISTGLAGALKSLINEGNDRSNVGSIGNATTPSSLPQSHRSLQTFIDGFSGILKSVPEPVQECLPQLLLQLASIATVPDLAVTELLERFPQLCPTRLNPNPQSPSGSGTSTQNPNPHSNTDAFDQEACLESKSVGSASKDGKVNNNENVMKNIGIDAPITPATPTDALNVISTGCATRGSSLVGGRKEAKAKDKVANVGFHSELLEDGAPSRVPAPGHNNPHSPSATCVDYNFVSECPFSGGPVSYIPPQVTNTFHKVCSDNGYKTLGSMFHKGIICDGCGSHPITGPRFKSKVKEDYDLCSVCFAEMGNEFDYIRMDRPVSHQHARMHLFNRRHKWAGGPRGRDMLRGYKKQTRLDSRFVSDVNVMDGTVMAPSTPFTKIWRLHNNGSMVWPRGTKLVWSGGHTLSNLVSVEIEVPAGGLPVGAELDIAVDFVAPSLPGEYTSYWRMASPSGQMFGQRVWVLIQVDESVMGLLSDGFQALDLNLPPVSDSALKGPCMNSIPTTADPFHPGNSSSTDKPLKPDQPLEGENELQFPINDALLVGQNSDISDEATSARTYPVINCGGSIPYSSQVPSVSYPPVFDFAEQVIDATPPPRPSPMVFPPPSPMGFPLPSEKRSPMGFPPQSEKQSPMGFSPQSEKGSSMGFPPPSEKLSPMVSSPPTEKLSPMVSSQPSEKLSPIASQPPSKKLPTDNDVEETLLKELEQMGFIHFDLNKEVLRMTDYDLEKSVDELCGVSEWDPILEELDEMGFIDRETNRKLLVKNNGSIKRVVMELISGEDA